MKKFKCQKCNKNFKSKKQLSNHELSFHTRATKKNDSSFDYKKLKNWGITIIVLLLLGWGFFSLSNQPRLPPTSMEGHVEQNPPSHILKQPMSDKIQRHMLEHADGVEGGPGGIIINYDCKNYVCEPELVSKLEAFAIKYPETVYVAPFKNMKEKIALTRLGRIQTLNEYNEEEIERFISR